MCAGPRHTGQKAEALHSGEDIAHSGPPCREQSATYTRLGDRDKVHAEARRPPVFLLTAIHSFILSTDTTHAPGTAQGAQALHAHARATANKAWTPVSLATSLQM